MIQRWLCFVVIVGFFGGCRAHDTSTLTGSTELGGYSEDLTSYTADRGVLKAYRQESEGQGFLSFCTLARSLVRNPSFFSRKLPYHLLQIEEAVAIQQYSQIPNLNATLRNGDKVELANRRNLILATSSGLNRLPRHQGRVFRGALLPANILDAYRSAQESGATFIDKAFISASLKSTVAISFSGGMGNTSGSKTLYIITAKSGHLIEGISIYPNEREVIFPPGTEFKVSSISTRSLDEVKNLTVEKLPPLNRVKVSSDKAPDLQGCDGMSSSDSPGSIFGGMDGLGGMALHDEESTTMAPRFFGPVGDLISLKVESAQLNLQDAVAENDKQIIVIELEDVPP